MVAPVCSLCRLASAQQMWEHVLRIAFDRVGHAAPFASSPFSSSVCAVLSGGSDVARGLHGHGDLRKSV